MGVYWNLLKKKKQSSSQCVTVTDLKEHDSTLDDEQDACSLNTYLTVRCKLQSDIYPK